MHRFRAGRWAGVSGLLVSNKKEAFSEVCGWCQGKSCTQLCDWSKTMVPLASTHR